MVLATLVALSVLILVHEFGHFFAAKSVDIAAPRFSLGLGPRVAGFQWGETDFVISAIPLGGYVKMAGMEDDEATESLEGGGAAQDEPVIPPERTFDAKPLWARAWVISAGVVMNLLFALFANVGLFAFRGEPGFDTRRVDPVPAEAGAAAAVAAVPEGAEVTAVNGVPVAYWDEMQRELERAPAGPVTLAVEGGAPVRLALPARGPARDTVMGALLPYMPPVLGGVVPGEAAARAGLREGDRIVAIDGAAVGSWTQAVQAFRGSPGRSLRVEVERGDERVAVTVTPEAEEARVDGETRTVGMVGAAVAAPPTYYRGVGIGEAVTMGAQETWRMIMLLLTTLRDLVTGELSPRNLGGLLAIGEASGESASRGLGDYILFLAFLSVNLAVLNLLPIPILDGGHLMFLLVEAVRGRPLSVEARIRLSHVGLIIVVGLMLWANGNDVVRLVERLLSR